MEAVGVDEIPQEERLASLAVEGLEKEEEQRGKQKTRKSQNL